MLPVLAVLLGHGAVLAARSSDDPHPRVTDSELVGSVRSSLHARLGDAAERIEVVAEDGFVFLYGEVPSERLRSRAETIADRVAGVRAVSNELVAGRPILRRSVPRRPE
jgi:osmotically-inducible protein OsmY